MKEEKRKFVGQRSIKSRGKIVFSIVILSFLAAVVIYTVMLQTEKKLLEESEKKVVFVAKKEIPRGLILDEKNWAEFTEEMEADASVVPDTLMVRMTSDELIATWSVEKGCILTSGMFSNPEQVLEDMNQPVLAGFRAEDLYQVVGGVLRAGDRIHIFRVDKEKKEVELLWENLYVQQVFDNNGVRIEPDDDMTCAQRMNIYMEQADVERFYEELYKGEVRVVKVI